MALVAVTASGLAIAPLIEIHEHRAKSITAFVTLRITDLLTYSRRLEVYGWVAE